MSIDGWTWVFDPPRGIFTCEVFQDWLLDLAEGSILLPVRRIGERITLDGGLQLGGLLRQDATEPTTRELIAQAAAFSRLVATADAQLRLIGSIPAHRGTLQSVSWQLR